MMKRDACKRLLRSDALEKLVVVSAAAAFLSACAVGSNKTPAPISSAPVAITTNTTTRTEGSLKNSQKASGFQIAQCYSSGAREVGINYPEGWARRVSRAEIEDELLGGATSQGLAAENAFAQPDGAISFTYPQAALNPPTEGICEIKFNLSRRGRASNILSACSSPLFLEAANEAVKLTRFKPVRINGTAAKGVNLTYNMQFCLAD